MPKTLRFKNAEAYRKWNAYRHIHVEGKVPHHHQNRPVEIHGRPHRVVHAINCAYHFGRKCTCGGR